jgi:hypothetical protein
MGIEQEPDDYWRDTNDTSNQIGFAALEDALNGYDYNADSDNENIAMETAATVGFFAIFFIKLYIWLIKKGIIPCLGIAGGTAAFIGIPYGLITKTSFMGTIPYALWIIFGVGYIGSLIAWNKKIKQILIPMGIMGVIAIAWIFMLKKEVTDVPNYMWISNKPKYFDDTNMVDGFRYKVNEEGNGVIIINYTGKKKGDIVIPAEFDGLPVVKIEGRYLFSEVNKKPRITSVTFPDTVEYIDDIFMWSKKITQITLPRNLKCIGSSAFIGSGLTSLIIPEGVTDIGNNAFSDCENLTDVYLPKSLKRLGKGAFENTPACEKQNFHISKDQKILIGTYYLSVKPGTVFIKEMDCYFKESK